MQRLLPLALGLCILTSPVCAASARVELAISALAKLEKDAAKLTEFCRLNAQYAAAGEDEAKNEAADRDMESFLKGLGREYVIAWQLGEELDAETEDGKALNAAFDSVESKCPG